ncbi:hypothetical protein ACFL26_01575 [Patescibacteria group bacterium]
MTRSRTFLTLKFALVEVVGSFVYFPVWWYTGGTLRTLKFCGGFWVGLSRMLGYTIWIKNLFTPMFGQYDIVSRLISFFLRLVTIIAYTVVLLLAAVLMLALLVVWLVLPAFVLYELWIQLSGTLKP